jgi:hypothetical protein
LFVEGWFLTPPLFKKEEEMEITTYQAPELISTIETRLVKLEGHFKQVISSDNDDELAKAYGAYQKTLKDFQDQRMPLTKRFDEIKSKFTALEKRVSTCIDLVKDRRNLLAKNAYEAKMIEEKRQREELEAKRREIEAQSTFRIEVKQYVINLISHKKELLVKSLVSVTLDNYDKKMKGLQSFATDFDPKTLERFGKYPEILSELLPELSDLYRLSMEDFKQQCINEMSFIAEMDKDSKEEFLRQFRLSIQGEKDSALEIEDHKETIEKDAKETEAILDSITTSEDVKTPNVIKIEVVNKAAYKAIAAYWFDVIFPTYDKEMGTKTINSMIIDLERHAKNTGERLNVSGVKYNEEFSVR